MEPYRIVRSEKELDAVAIDSLVCPAYYLGSIYEKSAPNEWVEPGSEETLPTAAVWEVMTGSYETLVIDEDREVWVLIDAAAPKLVRPPRPEDSPDYATRVQTRTAEIMTHPTLDDARKAIEAAVGDGVTVGHTNIWVRSKDAYDFHPSVYINPGTEVADFPLEFTGGLYDMSHSVRCVQDREVAMPHYPDEVIRYSRDDLLQALAGELGSTPDDPRILDAYDQIVSEWALHADDPDTEYSRYFQDGAIATKIDLVAVQTWAKGRVLL